MGTYGVSGPEDLQDKRSDGGKSGRGGNRGGNLERHQISCFPWRTAGCYAGRDLYSKFDFYLRLYMSHLELIKRCSQHVWVKSITYIDIPNILLQ